MKFRGTLHIVFNQDIESIGREEFSEIIDDLNKEILIKGAKDPAEAAKILDWSIEDSRLILQLESGRKVRIDDAALRIRNAFLRDFCRKHKVGVRELILRDTVLELDGRLGVYLKVPFIRDIEVRDEKTYIYFTELTESEFKKQIFVRLIRLLEEKEAKEKWKGKAEHWQLIKQSREKIKVPFREDPNKILEDIGWIKRFAIGQWIFTPPFTYLMNMMKNLLYEEVLKPLGFQEAVFPKIYPLEIGLKTGHLKGTINSMLFSCLPKSYEISEYEDLIDYMHVVNKVPTDLLTKHLKPPGYFLCFAQCEPFYQFFSGEIMGEDNLPVKWFDKSGPSFRWEAGGIHGVERVIEFHRVEIVWLGKPEQVIDIRNRLLERYEYFMDRVLDLEWRWAWVTPWYYEQAGEIREVEMNIDQPGTIDFEAWLPYRGERGDRKAWLEIGNISIHGVKFTKPFRIKHSRKETLWTGCSGFGTERWLISFLAQKGFDPSNWPSPIREYLRKNPFPTPVSAVTYPKSQESRKLLDEITKKFIDV